MLAALGRSLGPRPGPLSGAAAATGLARWLSTQQGANGLQVRLSASRLRRRVRSRPASAGCDPSPGHFCPRNRSCWSRWMGQMRASSGSPYAAQMRATPSAARCQCLVSALEALAPLRLVLRHEDGHPARQLAVQLIRVAINPVVQGRPCLHSCCCPCHPAVPSRAAPVPGHCGAGAAVLALCCRLHPSMHGSIAVAGLSWAASGSPCRHVHNPPARVAFLPCSGSIRSAPASKAEGPRQQQVSSVRIACPQLRSLMTIVTDTTSVACFCVQELTTRCVVVRSTVPGVFCAGADLKARAHEWRGTGMCGRAGGVGSLRDRGLLSTSWQTSAFLFSIPGQRPSHGPHAFALPFP